MTLAITCTALLAALVFALGANVSRLRGTRGDRGQFPSDPRDGLLRAIRAHGNATEYAPILAVLMLLVATREPTALAAGFTIAATAARYVHAGALLRGPSLAANTVTRTIGAAGTYLAGLGLAALALTTL